MNSVDALMADQVAHRFAASQRDMTKRIDQVVDLVTQGDYEKALPLFQTLYTELQGFASPGLESKFEYLARNPDSLRHTLSRLVGHWTRQQQRQEQSSPVKPALTRLIRHLEEVQELRNTVRRSPRYDLIAPWIESLEITEALGVLKNFVAE